jgi:hypothetical protein
MPQDIKWMLELTAPRIKSMLGHSNRKLKLDDTLLKKTNRAIAKAVQGHNYLTRQELKALLADKGIKTNVQRLAHIVGWAELDGLICSGPRREKQFTYALLEERAPKATCMTKEEALANLAMRYFTSHGPAQVKDFSWWSGLSMKDCQEALTLVQPKVEQSAVDNKTYWFSPYSKKIASPPTALLLSIFDEYAIAYKDRSDLSDKRDVERMISMGNSLTAVLILDGRVAGTWKRVMEKGRITLSISSFRKLSAGEKDAIEAQASKYGKFFGADAVATWAPAHLR